MFRPILTLSLLAAAAAMFAACGGEQPASPQSKAPAKLTRPVPPATYKGLTRPETASAEEGRTQFAQCATCHGEKGDGDSPTGKALTPPASDLTQGNLQDAMIDDYIFWRISEGGMMPPFNSGMTPFKGTMSEEQRWHVVAYVRSLRK